MIVEVMNILVPAAFVIYVTYTIMFYVAAKGIAHDEALWDEG